MVRYILAGLIILCAAVIVVSFFTPWAKASISATKVAGKLTEAAKEGPLANTPFAGKFIRGLETATTAIQGVGDIKVKTAVSGYDIPVLVNKKSSQIALSIIQIMVKSTEGLGAKSFLVYLLPLLGIGCAVLAVTALRIRIAIIGAAVISGVISIGGLYNLMTTNLSSDTLPIQISIESGLWHTMYAYLFIFIFSATWFVIDIKSK